jgi:hypothetical protein
MTAATLPPPAVYDSRVDNLLHIIEVQRNMRLVVEQLLERLVEHDQSKLVPPERELFDIYTGRLQGLNVGTPAYEENRRMMGPALAHHYRCNSHHPEHYPNGILGMSLLDLIEMLCDWKASCMRSQTPRDVRQSIEELQSRFKYSDELKQIFLNTVACDLERDHRIHP